MDAAEILAERLRMGGMRLGGALTIWAAVWAAVWAAGAAAKSPAEFGLDPAEICLGEGPPDSVQAACTAALDAPGGPRARLHLARAGAALRLGAKAAALGDLDAALAVAPGLAAARRIRADLRAGAGDWPAAAQDYTILIRVGDTPELRLRRGMARLALGETEAASRDFRAGLAADPRDARLHQALGLARRAAGDWPGAAAAFEAALAADPRRTALHLEIAHAWCAAGDPLRAHAARMAAAEAGAFPARAAERFLRAAGFWSGPDSGRFTPALASAMRRWAEAGCPI